MPAAPPPPGLFTSATGTGTIFSSVMILWITRASRSAPPPTANGITNSTSLVGFQPWPKAASGTASNSDARKRMGFPLLGKNYTRDHGPVGRGRLERRAARHQVERRRVRQGGKRVSQLGERAAIRPLPPV